MAQQSELYMYEMQNAHVETVVGAEFESTYNMQYMLGQITRTANTIP